MSEVISNEPPTTGISADEKQWAMFAHLSGLVASFLGPLIIWLIQKDKMKFVEDQGKEALNFQLNIAVLAAALGPIAAILAFVTFGFGALLVVPVGFGVAVLAIVFPILAGIKANAGEAYRYPYIVRVIK
jgi:uncharacterized Tic20 family protein